MSNLIFNNLFEKIGISSNNVNTYFDNFNFYNNNLYDLLYKLPKHLIIFYFFLILIIFTFINRLHIRSNEILSFLICGIVLLYLINRDFKDFVIFTKSKKDKLNFLDAIIHENIYRFEENVENPVLTTSNSKNKSYLYLAPLFIEFFYDVREMLEYNVSSYANCIIHCSNMLGLEYESSIGVNYHYYNYQVAIEESKKALNEFQSIIYKMPSTIVSYNKLRDSQKILHQLLNSYLMRMSNLFKNKNKIEEITIEYRPDNFYDENFFISSNDTETKNYISQFNLY